MNDKPSVNIPNQEHIDLFIDAMWLESGLSKNTLSAYRTDLNNFAKFILAKDLLKADQSDIQGFLAILMAQGTKASSSARVLSTMRRFYRYQIRENRIATDPCAQVLSPKQGRPLPKAVSESQVVRGEYSSWCG